MQNSRFILGLLGAGLAIALVMSVSTLTSGAADQPAKPQTSNMMTNDHMGNVISGTDMMNGMGNMQDSGMQNDMGSMMNGMSMMMDMMSMNNMMQNSMMGSYMNMNNATSMQHMMSQMMGGNYIHMGMNRFMPSNMTTGAGTTITWQNHDHVIHNVVGVFKTDAGAKISVRSPDLSHMDSWSYTFDEPGIFEYVCSYHESQGMRGRILISS